MSSITSLLILCFGPNINENSAGRANEGTSVSLLDLVEIVCRSLSQITPYHLKKKDVLDNIVMVKPVYGHDVDNCNSSQGLT